MDKPKVSTTDQKRKEEEEEIKGKSNKESSKGMADIV